MLPTLCLRVFEIFDLIGCVCRWLCGPRDVHDWSHSRHYKIMNSNYMTTPLSHFRGVLDNLFYNDTPLHRIENRSISRLRFESQNLS
jgi:hypothetical protein